MRVPFVFFVVFALTASSASLAHAQRSRAARLFGEAERLAAAGNHSAAADRYEEAHRLVPSNLVLALAASERIEAAEWELAIDAVERLEAERGDPDVDAFLPDAYRAILEARVRLAVRCASPCRIATDGGALEVRPEIERRIWLVPAIEHRIWVVFETGGAVERIVRLAPGDQTLDVARTVAPEPRATAELALATDRPRPESPTIDSPPPRRAGRVIAYLSLATALVLDGVAIASAVDTARVRERYARDPDEAGWARAVASQRRTNILAGVGVTVSAATSAGLVHLVARRTRVSGHASIAERSIGVGVATDF